MDELQEKLKHTRAQLSHATHLNHQWIDSAKRGVFGSLKSFNPKLQTIYTQLIKIMPMLNMPITLVGPSGVGKNTTALQWHELHQLFRKIDEKYSGRFSTVKASQLTPGFFSNIIKKNTRGDTYLIEDIENFSLASIDEFLAFMNKVSSPSFDQENSPVLILSSTQNLNFNINTHSIPLELIAVLSANLFSIPRLFDRYEDFELIITQSLKKLNVLNYKQSRTWINFLKSFDYKNNILDLNFYLKTCCDLFGKDFTSWDFKVASQKLNSYKIETLNESNQYKISKNLLLETISICDSNYKLAAKKLNLSLGRFIEYMLYFGIR